MRSRILGAIGVTFGGGVLLSNSFVGLQVENGAYAAGQMAGLIFGGLLLAIGLYYLVSGSKKQP